MAYRSFVSDTQQREQRQRRYNSSDTIGSQFPKVSEVVLGLRFTGVEGRPQMSPYKQIYTAGMQSFFELQCPSPECGEGGFDLHSAVTRAAQRPGEPHKGQLQCRGVTTSGGRKGNGCPVAIEFEVEVRSSSNES